VNNKKQSQILQDEFFTRKKEKNHLWYTGDNKAVDALTFAKDNNGKWCILLIKRRTEQEDKYALPGGFVNTKAAPQQDEPFIYDASYENYSQAAARELKEETSINIRNYTVEETPIKVNQETEDIYSFNTVGFDNRSTPENYISTHPIAFIIQDKTIEELSAQADDDARFTGWTTLDKIKDLPFTFEHHKIILDKAIEQLGLMDKPFPFMKKSDLAQKLEERIIDNEEAKPRWRMN
jgi:ADP-ribose pyrophosphatase YjhB (NUDIX family)